MWIDIIIVFVSALFLFALAFLHTRAEEEMKMARQLGEKRNARIYQFCTILITIMMLGLCGVLAYVYVFQ